MRKIVAGVALPLVLLVGCSSASSQPSCSDPAVLNFLRQKLDQPFNGAKASLLQLDIPVPEGLGYELIDMAAVDATGLVITCTAQAIPMTGHGETYGGAEITYTLVRNDAGGINIRLRADGMEQLQAQTYGGVMMAAVRNGQMPGQIPLKDK